MARTCSSFLPHPGTPRYTGPRPPSVQDQHASTPKQRFTLKPRRGPLALLRPQYRVNANQAQLPGIGLIGGIVVLVVVVVVGTVVVVVVVVEEVEEVEVDDVVVGEVDVVVEVAGGATGTPVVSVTVSVDVGAEEEPAGASTAQATRPPASPVASVSASGPGAPSWVYRGGMLAKLSGP